MNGKKVYSESRRRRKAQQKKREEYRWAKKSGKVKVSFVDPATLKPDHHPEIAEMDDHLDTLSM
jgi:hypothetical protein